MCAVGWKGTHVYMPVCGRYVNEQRCGNAAEGEKRRNSKSARWRRNIEASIASSRAPSELGGWRGGGGKGYLPSCLTMYLYTDILEYCTDTPPLWCEITAFPESGHSAAISLAESRSPAPNSQRRTGTLVRYCRYMRACSQRMGRGVDTYSLTLVYGCPKALGQSCNNTPRKGSKIPLLIGMRSARLANCNHKHSMKMMMPWPMTICSGERERRKTKERRRRKRKEKNEKEKKKSKKEKKTPRQHRDAGSIYSRFRSTIGPSPPSKGGVACCPAPAGV